MTIRAFIAYDFALNKRGSFANVLEDAKDSGAPDLLIRYAGDSDSPKDHGSLWDTVVGGPIDLADRFLAYIDLPNANVGFEIGYAFGKGKPVGIYRFSSIEHEWLKQPPLVGHIRHHANDARSIHDAIKDHGFMKLAAPPPPGEHVMFLCPNKGGSPFRRQIDNSWHWAEPPLTEWTINRLSEQFQDVGCVVWIIVKSDEEEGNRDGAENTALSLIAGFAHAHPNIDLHVFVHENARFVADLGHVSKRFSSNADLRRLLTSVQTNWETKRAARSKPLSPPAENSGVVNALESEKEALRKSYLKWIIACHERLQFRGVQHARGGVVSVELKQVYLALQADGTNPLERAAARQSLLAELDRAIAQGEITPEEADNAIWLFVAGSPTMPSLESRDRLNQLDDKLKEILNLGEAYFRESQLVVLGDPGSGKTTLARWLSLVSAQAALHEQATLVVPLSHVDPSIAADERTISLGRVRIPILLRVADYADERRRQVEEGNPPPRLVEYFGKHGWLGNMPSWDGGGARDGERIDSTKLNQYLVDVVKAGDALIILDGLDEIPASALRDEIVEEVDFFAQHHVRAPLSMATGATFEGHQAITRSNLTANSPGNRLIVTSRIAGYHAAALRGNLAHVTVEPMAPAATARFITNWMQAVHAETADTTADPKATQDAAESEAQKLIAKLKEPRQRGGRELATNPLLCGILATVFRKEKGDLPQERVELYRQAVDLLMDIWIRRGREEEDLRRQRYELLDVLEPLAEHIHRHEPTGLIPEEALSKLATQFLAESRRENHISPSAALRTDVDDLIRVIREDVGLLAARGEKVYGFLHLTFQEYFAARFLVRDAALSCARIREHLGDARWREAIRLGFGHLSISEPSHFKALTTELLAAETELGDLLPQAALTLVGSIQDIRELDSDSVELLADQLITTYSVRELSDRLPRRRDLLEGGLKRLIEARFGKQVELSLIRSLAASSREPALAAAGAEIICALDHHSARITDALLDALANDLLVVGCPIHRALRLSVSPRYGQDIPRVIPNPKSLPFRQALLAKPELAERIRSDFDWLRVVVALYGGLGEHEVAKGLRTYNEIACYLQQEDASRSRYELAYRDEWGGEDGNVVLNMAVYLDTKGGGLTKRGQNPFAFNPTQVCQDSVWTSRILAALERGQGVKPFLEAIQNSGLPSTSAAKMELGIIQLAIGERATEALDFRHEDVLGGGQTLVSENLSDAVARTGHQLIDALSILKGKMNSKEWWAVTEASLTTLLRHGGEPLGGKLLSLRDEEKSDEGSLLLAEALYHFGRGWGDDAVYNSAVFADTAKVTHTEFLGAFSLLPITAHSAWNLYFNEWPLVAIPPAVTIERELHPSIITNLEMMPSSLGFMRFWTLQVLKPIIDGNPDLLPEILAFGLGNVGQRGVRNDVFSTFAPELLDHPQPSYAVFERVQALTDPYHRARASLRLSIHIPAKRQTLLADAAQLGTEIADPDHAAQIFEWLASIAPDSQRGEYWSLAKSRIMEIVDSDERARMWGRLGLLARPEDANECFGLALQACAEINDEFDRGTTIRLLRRVFGGLPEMDEKFQKLTSAILNPAIQARASEDWGSVFRNLDPSVFSGPEHRHLWAVLFVAAQADQGHYRGQTTIDSQWVQLANEPSRETSDKLLEHSQSELLRCSPLATLCLDRLFASGHHTLVSPLIRRIRASAAEVIPFWWRQLVSSNSDVSSIAALILGETHGVSGELMPGLIAGLCSPDDLTRNRASELLNGFDQGKEKEPVFRTSLIGREGLDLLFAARSMAGSPRSIGNVVTWFCEGLLYDSPEQVQAWARSFEQDPSDAASSYALRTIHHIETLAFDQLMIELRERAGHVKKAILVGLTHLAKHERLDPRQFAAITESVRESAAPDLQACESFDVMGQGIVRVVLDTLSESGSEPVNPKIVAKARELLRARHAFSWSSVYEIPDDSARLARLQAIGATMYSTGSDEAARWKNAAECAREGLNTPGFLELLCEWTAFILDERPDDPLPLDYERTYVIETLAGAAMLAPARFLRCSPSKTLQPLLITAAISNGSYTARADSIRLLGYQRQLSLDVLVALRSSLLDVSFVRDSAMEAVTLFRHMDADVLPELKRWLSDESGLVAYATAQLLTGIARHAQTTGRLETGRSSEKLRREITSILADAARDPRANRQLDFGAASFPTPFVPRLCDHFYDCMLKVAGFEEFRRSYGS